MKKTFTTETTKCEPIAIMTQAFYGNRTGIEILSEDLDRFILGYLDDSLTVTEPIDRTVVNVPNTDNLVIIYNKLQEKSGNKRETDGKGKLCTETTRINS